MDENPYEGPQTASEPSKSTANRWIPSGATVVNLIALLILALLLLAMLMPVGM